MKLLYFGDYDADYSRHKILLKGLNKNNADVLVVNIEAQQNKLKKYQNIYQKLKELKNEYDVIIIAYSNSRFVWFVKLFVRKPVVWDPFYSLYDNWVFDRKIANPRSIKAGYYWLLDWICCVAADLILLDSNAQIDYFNEEFRIRKDKFIRVLVGADTSIMFPRERGENNEKFTVFFYGTYIPVQGADILVRAAKLLEKENISIIMLGQGQEYSNVKKIHAELGIKNIVFLAKVPFADLPSHIADADICLGLLSNISRALRSIPNKIYDATAMGKACINADTPAIREIFQDKESILLFKGGDPNDLAEKILFLKNNPALRDMIAENALRVFRNIATPEIIGKNLIRDIKKLIK